MSLPTPSSILRTVARSVSLGLSRYPELRSALRSGFLSLPASWRGRQMVHDHFASVSALGPQRFALIGANDGVTDDHVFFFVRRHKWKGVAVEPVPLYFKQLSQAVQGWPVTCLNVAIHDSATEIPFYFLEDTAEDPLPAYAKGVGSFSKAQVESLSKEIPSLDKKMKEIQVQCMPLTQALEKAGLDGLDVVVIDTEGYDANIVRQIDFQRWKPNTIVFEHKHLQADDLASVLKLLESQGFTWEKDRADVLAYRKPQC